jgi:polyphosphate kinase
MNVFDLARHGFSVLDDNDDDPVLLTPEGTPVDTWREGYPYGTRMTREQYEMEKRLLQMNC